MTQKSTGFNNSNYETVKLPYNMGDRELFKDGKLEIYKHKTELKSCAEVLFDRKFHGPPKYVHGGAQAYILDEVMGSTCWLHNIPVVAKKITVEFKKPAPLLTSLFVYGEILSREEKLARLIGKICDAGGSVFSTATGDFRILSDHKLKEFAP